MSDSKKRDNNIALYALYFTVALTPLFTPEALDFFKKVKYSRIPQLEQVDQTYLQNGASIKKERDFIDSLYRAEQNELKAKYMPRFHELEQQSIQNIKDWENATDSLKRLYK